MIAKHTDNMLLSCFETHGFNRKQYVLNENAGFKKQMQPVTGVPRKRCSENMQQICRRTTMLKCDFKETLLKSHFGMDVLL